MRGIALGLVWLFSSACATFGTYQSARPIDKGSFQIGIEPGMWHVEDSGAAPVVNLTARYGFGSRWDLGARVGTSGIGLTGKVGLTSPASRPWAVAVAPSFSTFPRGSRPFHAQVPLLVGLGLGPHEVTIAPKLQGWSAVRTVGQKSRRSTMIAAGVSVGASVRIARGVRLLPEVSFVRPIVGSLDTRAAFADIEIRPGRPLYQVGFGVLLGGEPYWWRRGYYPPSGTYPYPY